MNAEQRILQIYNSIDPAERLVARNAFFQSCGIALHEGQARVNKEMDLWRIVQICGGERGGKSQLIGYFLASECVAPYLLMIPQLAKAGVTVSEEMLREALGKRLYWIVGPDYTQARKEFEYALEVLLKYGFVDPGKNTISTPKEGAWRFECIDGTIIETKTGEDTRKLAAAAPDGIIMAEPAQMSFEAFLKSMGRVAEKRGWITMCGTLEQGGQWYNELFDQWHDGDETYNAKSFSIPSWENTFVYPLGRLDPEIIRLEQTMPPDVFQERIAAIPYSRVGLVIPEFDRATHVTELAEYVPGLPVWLKIDPAGWGRGGRSAYAVIAGQEWKTDKEDEWGYSDFWELYEYRMSTQEIVNLVMQQEWWRDVTGIVMDIAGRARVVGASHKDIWETTGKPVYDVKTLVPDLINRHRTVLRDPGTGRPHKYIHPRCVHMIDEYSRWKYGKDGKPKDEWNDAIKACGYYELWRWGVVAPRADEVLYLRLAFSPAKGQKSVHRIRRERIPPQFRV